MSPKLIGNKAFLSYEDKANYLLEYISDSSICTSIEYVIDYSMHETNSSDILYYLNKLSFINSDEYMVYLNQLKEEALLKK